MGVWYRTGTVAVTNGSPDVVGVGTLWLTQASIGDIFLGPDLVEYEITSITDDTHLALKQINGTAAYAGTTNSAQVYAIIRNFTSTVPAQLASQLAAMMTAWHVTTDELTAWLSGTGSVTVHDALGNAYSVQTPAALNAALNGRLVKSVAGGADVTLTTAEASNLFIELTGTLTANINLIMPAGVRHNFILNSTAGAFVPTVKTAAGTGVKVEQGCRELLECDGTNVVNALLPNGSGTQLCKLDPLSPAFTKTGAGTLSLKAGSMVTFPGVKMWLNADAPVTMPSLTGGTDYAIYVCTDGTIRADASFTAPTGYTTANSRRIGGFHYGLVTAGMTASIANGFNTSSTVTRNGTTANASAVITGLASTSDLMAGMTVSGTGIGAGAAIATVDSASQVTLTVNSTASATVSLTLTNTGMVWTQADVDKIAGINEFSIWDLNWRCKTPDLRGQLGFAYVVHKGYWEAIYMCSTDPDANGLSKAGTNIASGTVLPKIPAAFGGNGTTTYPAMGWWVANEIAGAYGCRLMHESEFAIGAFGVAENQSIGGAASTYPTTQRNACYTSRYGIEQASGHHWIWGEDSNFYSEAASPVGSWKQVTGNTGAAGSERGQAYTFGAYGLTRVILGGSRNIAADSGSRASNWNLYPWYSSWYLGLRAACDHLISV